MAMLGNSCTICSAGNWTWDDIKESAISTVHIYKSEQHTYIHTYIYISKINRIEWKFSILICSFYLFFLFSSCFCHEWGLHNLDCNGQAYGGCVFRHHIHLILNSRNSDIVVGHVSGAGDQICGLTTSVLQGRHSTTGLFPVSLLHIV